MPLQKCTINGKSGWKWGESGKCYIGANAKEKAIKQAIAIGEGKMPEDEDKVDLEELSNKLLKLSEEIGMDANLSINSSGKSKLNSLISQGRINQGSWEFTSADGNKLLGENGDDWDTYGSIHLAINSNANEKTKQYYAFPVAKYVGNEIQIFRRAVIAAKSIASGGRGAPNRPDVAKLADELLQKINSKMEKDENDFLFLDVFDNTKLLLTEKAEITPEGFLKTRAIVTNTGIFNYLLPNGEISRQLRDTDEVMKIDSLETLKNKPITYRHPEDLINSENIEELQKKGKIIGFTGSNVQKDNHAVSIDFTITNKEAIDKIKNKEENALSCGYRADVDYTKHGHAFGNNYYDAQQKNIRYNHIALVPQGRAGDLAQISMDSINENKFAIQIIDQNYKEVKMDGNNVNILIDEIQYAVDKDIAKYIHLLKSKNDSLQKESDDYKIKLSDLEGKKDAFEAEVKTLKTEIEKGKLTDEQIKNAVNERIAIQKIADFLDIKYDENKSNKELKLSIISVKNSKVDLSDKDDIYINAYYDSIVNLLQEDMVNKNANENKKNIKNNIPETKKEIRKDQFKKLNDAYNNYKGSASIKDNNVIISN